MSESEPIGVFISRGIAIRISNLSTSIGPDGEATASPITPELALDLWPLWLRIAVDHERMAKDARARLKALTGEHDDRHATALEDETIAGMVAIAASAFSIDAFYGAVKARIDKLPPTGPRSRRYAIVAETLKRAFVTSQESSITLRQNLREVFRFRDMTVHPSGEFRGAVLHPVMKVGVAVPNVAFRVENAQAVINLAISTIETLAKVPKHRHAALVEWCHGIPKKVEELKDRRTESEGTGDSIPESR